MDALVSAETPVATVKPSALSVPEVKLSICITTFNRAGFIGATLDSIFSQIQGHCEVVIVDGASTDNTEEVVSAYTQRFENLRYIKQPINQGIDRDYDRTIQLARGEYCWLMTDDDLLKPGAISRVLAELNRDLSILLVNYQRLENDLSEVVLERLVDTTQDACYAPDEMDRLFSDSRQLLIYIGSLIIKRSLWLSRQREPYFDTMLMHIGVIFQERLPSEARLIAEPLISYRDGNPRTFWERMLEIFLVKFPAAISSFAISDQEKKRSVRDYSLKLTSLLMYRAMNWYSLDDYRRWIAPSEHSIPRRMILALTAVAPGALMNALYIMTTPFSAKRFQKLRLVHLRMSPFYYQNYRLFGRKRGT